MRWVRVQGETAHFVAGWEGAFSHISELELTRTKTYEQTRECRLLLFFAWLCVCVHMLVCPGYCPLYSKPSVSQFWMLSQEHPTGL